MCATNRTYIIVSIVLSLLVKSSTIAQMSAPEDTWGVCIGISDYNDSILRDLSSAIQDAVEFCLFLRDNNLLPREHVITILSSEANQNNILEHLKRLNEQIDKKDRVYLVLCWPWFYPMPYHALRR